MSQVDAADPLEILTPIWYVRAETARAVRRLIRLVLAWAIAMDMRNDNQCDGVPLCRCAIGTLDAAGRSLMAEASCCR